MRLHAPSLWLLRVVQCTAAVPRSLSLQPNVTAMIDVVNNMRATTIGLRGMHDVAATLGTTL